MAMTIDFHTHILPAIDDGSASVEESIQLLEMEKQQGIEVVVATPHFYPQEDRPERFLSRRQQALEKLQQAAVADLPRIIPAAEVFYFNGISSWDGLKDLCIGDSRYILLEMPMEKWTDRMYDDIDGIWRRQGLIPVIAHLDRYINIFNVKQIVGRLERMNVVIQANGSFFVDKFRRKMALKLLQDNVINILGSDCHNMQDRKPNLGQAVEIIRQNLGQDYIEELMLTARNILPDDISQKEKEE